MTVKLSSRCWTTKAEKYLFFLSQSSLSSGGYRQTNRLLQCSVVSAKRGKEGGTDRKLKIIPGRQNTTCTGQRKDEIVQLKQFSLAGVKSKHILSRSAASQKLWPWKIHLLCQLLPGASETSPLITRSADHVLQEPTEMKYICLSLCSTKPKKKKVPQTK